MRSARRTVESRWAITKVVRPARRPSIASCTVRSLFASSELVASSKTRMAGSRTIARAIVNKLGSNRSILAVVLTAALLTYGGVSVFVAVFAAYPIAARLFRQANLPKRLIPGALVLGGGTLTMTHVVPPNAPLPGNVTIWFQAVTVVPAPGAMVFDTSNTDFLML